MKSLLFFIPILLFAAPLPSQAANAQATVHNLDGTTTTGEIAAITESAIRIRQDGSSTEFPFNRIRSIQVDQSSKTSTGAAAASAAWVTLIDGSILLAESYSVADDFAEVQLQGGPQVKISTSHLRHVRFKEQNKDQQEQWSKALKANGVGDLLVIRRGPRIDYLEGILRTVTAESVEFQLDSDWIPVGREKVEGLVYSRAESVETSASRGLLIDRAGSQIEAAAFELKDDALVVTTATGIDIPLRLNQVDRIEFAADNMVYLSDMQPASMEWAPKFSATPNSLEQLLPVRRPRNDRALGAGPGADGTLRLRYYREESPDEIRLFTRGLAIASRTTLEYELPEDARRFKAIAGIDERVATIGHVQLVIRGDDKVLFDEMISGLESPKVLDLDVENTSRLTILVDFGENGESGDDLNLCEARIVK